MTKQVKTIAELSREHQVMTWWVGAMTELERLGMVVSEWNISSSGTAFFDQIDSECPPTDDELLAATCAMSSGHSEADVNVGLRLLIGYRDQREELIAFCGKQHSD